MSRRGILVYYTDDMKPVYVSADYIRHWMLEGPR